MSAWGGAWGDAWGGAWGSVDVAAPPLTYGGGKDSAKSRRDRQQRDTAARNNEIIMAVVGIVVSGALEQ